MYYGHWWRSRGRQHREVWSQQASNWKLLWSSNSNVTWYLFSRRLGMVVTGVLACSQLSPIEILIWLPTLAKTGVTRRIMVASSPLGLCAWLAPWSPNDSTHKQISMKISIDPKRHYLTFFSRLCSEWLLVLFRNHSQRRKFCCHRGCWNKWDLIFESGSKVQSSRRYVGKKSLSDDSGEGLGNQLNIQAVALLMKTISLGSRWPYCTCLVINKWLPGQSCWERRMMGGYWASHKERR